MPDPHRLRKTIDRAIDAVVRQPGRTGRLIDLNDAAEILVAGDLHGHIANFQAIYKVADLANHPNRHLVLQEVVHGKLRYPLGGDKSHQLLDLFAALKSQFPTRVHLLMGNHELAQWTDRAILKSDDDLNMLFLNGVREAYGEQASSIYAGYRELFRTLPMAIRTANRIFISHSLPSPKSRENVSLHVLRAEEHAVEQYAPRGALYSLLWGRECSQDNAAAFLRAMECDWLITGHIPCDHGFATPNEMHIILDSCDAPAAYALLPSNRPLTRNEFYASVRLI